VGISNSVCSHKGEAQESLLWLLADGNSDQLDHLRHQRKFGDSVMSKTDTAMVNEVLGKLICHNSTCLIQEQETLGIMPIFWKDESEQADAPAILPLVRAQPI